MEQPQDFGKFISSLFSNIPRALLKVILFSITGVFLGVFLGWLIFVIFLKFSLLASSWWLIYFIPLTALLGLIGGILFGIRSGITFLIIDSGAGKFIVKNLIEGGFKTTDLVSDSEQVTGKLFEKTTKQVEKLRNKAKDINNGKEFIIKRKLKYFSLKLIADGIEAALKEPELKNDPKNRNQERFKEVVWRGVNFYLEEAIDDIVFFPIIIFFVVTVLLEALPLLTLLF